MTEHQSNHEINIESAKTRIGGDMVGRDKIVVNVNPQLLIETAKAFKVRPILVLPGVLLVLLGALLVFGALRLLQPTAQPSCEEALTKKMEWQGQIHIDCDEAIKKVERVSLKLIANDYSIVEVYSPLIPVIPNHRYRVSYWIKTDLEVNQADIYGKVIVAQYPAQAKEEDDIALNRLDPGFKLGENVSGQTDWMVKAYIFQTLPDAAYVRLRAIIGGPVGTARGTMWLDRLAINMDGVIQN